MPLYEFECRSCRETHELLMKVSEQVPECPSCGKESLNKLLSRTHFVLKGQGWYETDFKTKKQNTSSAGKSEAKAAKPSPQADQVKKSSTQESAKTSPESASP